jgi:hypothetical protein
MPISSHSEEFGSQILTRKGLQPVVAIATGCVLPILLVRPGLREITHYLPAAWPVSRPPRLENRRLGVEPLC